MNILQEYLTYIQTEQMASAAYTYSQPYNVLRGYYESCARSCDKFKYEKTKRLACIANCKVAVTKRELMLAQRSLFMCGKTGNLRCQDAAKKKILKIQKKLQNNSSILQRYRANAK
jgi:hypothetical protein